MNAWDASAKDFARAFGVCPRLCAHRGRPGAADRYFPRNPGAGHTKTPPFASGVVSEGLDPPPATRSWPPGEKATHAVSKEPTGQTTISWPVAACHRRTVWSQLPVTTV